MRRGFPRRPHQKQQKRKDVLDEMLFVLLQALPVLHVGAEIDLIDGPEASHLVLVHFPDIRVLDRQNDKSIGVVFKQWLG